MTRATSIISTSGAGVSLEARVAASFLAATLARASGPGDDAAHVVTRVEFQRSQPAAGFDDMHVHAELALRKYGADDAWQRAERAFGIQEAYDVGIAAKDVCARKLGETMSRPGRRASHDWLPLPGYIFSAEELADATRVDSGVAAAVLTAITAPPSPYRIQNASKSGLQG